MEMVTNDEKTEDLEGDPGVGGEMVDGGLDPGMVRRGHMSDTEVAEIEDMLNTSHMEDMEHLDILRPPHSHMSHRHEAAVHVSTFGSCKFI